MSLLSICQSAAATAPVAVPTAIVGNSDETSILLLALANDAGEELARRPQGGWISMIREYDFTTAALLPQLGGIANVNGVAVISGLASVAGITPNIWQASGNGVPNNAIVTAVTSNGFSFGQSGFGQGGFGGSSNAVTLNLPATSTGIGSFVFGQSDYPLPSDFERSIDNTFWDRSRFWSMRGPQSPQQWQLYKSSVIGRASIQRRFRFRAIRSVSGMPMGQFLSIDPLPLDNGSQLVFEYVSNGWCESYLGVPQNSWQADTDVGILDEYLIRLSLKYRLLRRLGLSYSEELDEYERQVDKAMAVDGGSAILDLTPNNLLSVIGPWNLPDSGYGGGAATPPPATPTGGFTFGSSGFGSGSF